MINIVARRYNSCMWWIVQVVHSLTRSSLSMEGIFVFFVFGLRLLFCFSITAIFPFLLFFVVLFVFYLFDDDIDAFVILDFAVVGDMIHCDYCCCLHGSCRLVAPLLLLLCCLFFFVILVVVVGSVIVPLLVVVCIGDAIDVPFLFGCGVAVLMLCSCIVVFLPMLLYYCFSCCLSQLLLMLFLMIIFVFVFIY